MKVCAVSPAKSYGRLCFSFDKLSPSSAGSECDSEHQTASIALQQQISVTPYSISQALVKYLLLLGVQIGWDPIEGSFSNCSSTHNSKHTYLRTQIFYVYFPLQLQGHLFLNWFPVSSVHKKSSFRPSLALSSHPLNYSFSSNLRPSYHSSPSPPSAPVFFRLVHISLAPLPLPSIAIYLDTLRRITTNKHGH